MKIYISAHCSWAAEYFAQNLRKINDIQVTSTWHHQPLIPTAKLTDETKASIAAEARETIKRSNILLELAAPDMVPGGKFVDVGIALASGLRVILVGRRENIKMYDPQITQVDGIGGLFKELGYELG